MNHQNLPIVWKEDPLDGTFYLSAMIITVSFLSLLFYFSATQKIREIEDLLNKKNVRIIDLLEKIENLEEKYNNMDSDHVDDYNSLIESFEAEIKDNMRLRQLNEKLEDELMHARTLCSEQKAHNEEFVKRIGRLESRLTRVKS
jgi:DNA repair exonuclease SbcCD ATPase subunit